MKPNCFTYIAVIITSFLIACAAAFPVARGELSRVDPMLPQADIPANTLNLADFGVGDGKYLNTDAFEKTIALLAEKGGGKLVVPAGIWLTGPIKMRSHTELHIDRGALIQFSRDYKLFPLTVINLKGEEQVDSTSPISGQNLRDVAVTGGGIIDGGGDAWRMVKKSKLTDGDWRALVKSGGVLNEKGDTWYPSQVVKDGENYAGPLRNRKSLNIAEYEPIHQAFRPRLLRLIACKNVLIKDVTFQNPPNWTMNPELCENVSILNVQVRNAPAAQNSDALDLESCRHAIIRDCIFDTGDDGICLKSGLDAAGRRIGVPTEDVLIENCVVYHAHGGFTIGSEMSGGVKNICINNCLFRGTDTGLRFKSTRGRGGIVENILISNIHMMDIPGDAINFNLFYGGKSPLDDAAGVMETNLPEVTEATPQFRDIHLVNIVCRGAKNAIVLQGLPEMPLRDITFKDISITAQQAGSVMDAENVSFEDVHVEDQNDMPMKLFRVKTSKLELVK